MLERSTGNWETNQWLPSQRKTTPTPNSYQLPGVFQNRVWASKFNSYMTTLLTNLCKTKEKQRNAKAHLSNWTILQRQFHMWKFQRINNKEQWYQKDKGSEPWAHKLGGRLHSLGSSVIRPTTFLAILSGWETLIPWVLSNQTLCEKKWRIIGTNWVTMELWLESLWLQLQTFYTSLLSFF